MKVINIKDNLYREGEYLVGFEQTGSHACYFIYGFIKKGNMREISPGEGHEEIIAVIEGSLEMTYKNESIVLNKGQSIYLKGEESITLRPYNCDLAIYVIAGGHSEHSHHH
ncbi:MAG: hypothetical protein N2440_01820 [Actinobacteria bacterium]|nr:hypothetical protein [Actinomycetota bacterium]